MTKDLQKLPDEDCTERDEIVLFYRKQWEVSTDDTMSSIRFCEIIRIQTYGDILYLIIMEVPGFVDVLVDLSKSDKTYNLRDRLYMLSCGGEFAYYRKEIGKKEELEKAIKVMEEFVERIQSLAWTE